MMRFSSSYGTGTGEQTADGCSIEFYRQLPYQGELDEIVDLLPPGASVLELGCGTGRLAGYLAARGHEVVGVDDSAAMLRHLPTGVEGVCASIEGLDLSRRFGIVLLPSHLINHPGLQAREAFLQCAFRHLDVGGSFYLKRHDPNWLRTVQPGKLSEWDGVEYIADAVTREGKILSMTLRYRAFGDQWTHSFSAEALDETEVERLLRAQGFVSIEWHGAQRLWAGARRR